MLSSIVIMSSMPYFSASFGLAVIAVMVYSLLVSFENGRIDFRQFIVSTVVNDLDKKKKWTFGKLTFSVLSQVFLEESKKSQSSE